MTYTAYVTVRLNSKRVPKKSIKKIGGSSLVNTAITKLNQITSLNEIILYCSDDSIQNYITGNINYNFIKRPSEFDGDFVTFNDILDSLIDNIKTDYIVFLCVTSPFISVETINDMIEKVESKKYDSSFLAYEINSFCWYDNNPLNYIISTPDVNPEYANLINRTQDLKPVVVENTGLYIFSVDLYKKHKRRIGFNPYIKVVDELEAWDIDTPEDFEIAKLIGKKYGS
jgi:CMP-N-acetylneuraminic acid synthetase